MRRVADEYRLSASDLVAHMACGHAQVLDRQVADGQLQAPFRANPFLEVLGERGLRHEQGYVEHLRASGLQVVEIAGSGIDSAAVSATTSVMASGAQVIVQGALRHGMWDGRADVLLRVDSPSALGAWSYEPLDTKLARETKSGTVLQLSLYADLLGAMQGREPDHVHVVAPWTNFEPQTHRVADFAAYYRWAKRRLEMMLQNPQASYPEPVGHCDVCRWFGSCDERRRADDHLSFVPGLAKAHALKLHEHGIARVTELAAVPVPLPWKPKHGGRGTFEKLREQARVLCATRATGQIVYELLPPEPSLGLSRLPTPSHGDVFLDFEGDPFVGERGLEYLFGYVFRDEGDGWTYRADWALGPAAEKAAFERFIDFVLARLERWPDLHVYHYAPYEPAALKRLMGRHGTRADELDTLLRAQRFVDLYAVVRQGVRIGVESYSIKRLEPLYEFERDAALPDANKALNKVQAALELSGGLDGLEEAQAVVEAYNADDCFSTQALRTWLEARRSDLVAQGAAVERPASAPGDSSDAIAADAADVAALVERLTAGVSADPVERTADEHGRWVLAQLLSWHRREDKADWWEFFRLADLSAEELLDERCGLGGLMFEHTVGGTAACPIHCYSFPLQETELRGGETLRSAGGAHLGSVEAISAETGQVHIKKRRDTASFHPEGVFPFDTVPSGVLAAAVRRLGAHVADHGLDADGPFAAARDLLLRRPPRAELPLVGASETVGEAAVRLALTMTGGVLPIQGPPGAGKTYTGAKMICALVRAGRRVAITAPSHKVVRNLLDAVIEAAREQGLPVRCVQKPAAGGAGAAGLDVEMNNTTLLQGIGARWDVAGGTAWLWAREDAADVADVLFVDEAAQMSLANVIAVSHAAPLIVLLGDPRQLDQPTKASHPDGADASALDHVLGGELTLPADRGLFLAETWRLPPTICRFTSEAFYEGRLIARPGSQLQVVDAAGPLGGAGLRYVPVVHSGASNCSPEEADKVAKLVHELLDGSPFWIDRDGVRRPLTLDDVLVIAPYNAQVFELQARLPGARVGTVDKFQGQEAPVVIYSLTSSTSADAPRGMEFLYSLNRLNVATSRAKCVCAVVGSPALFEPDCRTVRHMQLANALCRYRELAA
jgi:predicted RecB family nuclease